MDSLHQNAVANAFAGKCYLLWMKWLSFDGSATEKRKKRIAMFEEYHGELCSSVGLPVVKVVPDDTLDHDEGAFGKEDWEMDVSGKVLSKDDLLCEEYVEFCKSVYHETRHAEQIYRVAQALALGRLEFPGDQNVSTKLEIEANLELNGQAAQHAVNNRNTYLNFRATPALGHCESGGQGGGWNQWDWTVNEWMDYSFRSGRRGLMNAGQAAPAGQNVVNLKLYKGAADETDARAMEPLLRDALIRKIPRYSALKTQSRTHPSFGK